MADIIVSKRRTPYGPLAATNRYIIGDVSEFAVGGSRKVAVSIDLNGGTLTFTFQGRVPGSASGSWKDIRATPLSTGTVAIGGTATENWQVDADGLEIAVNVTVATGSPQFTWS